MRRYRYHLGGDPFEGLGDLASVFDQLSCLFEDDNLRNTKEAFLKKSIPYNIEENPDNYIVSIEMPGVIEDEVNISFVKNRKLEIKAKYSSSIRQGELEWNHVFESVDPNKITADFKNGILTVILYKKEDEIVKIGIEKK